MERELKTRGLELAAVVIKREIHRIRLTIAKREVQERAHTGIGIPKRLEILREQAELLELALAAVKDASNEEVRK